MAMLLVAAVLLAGCSDASSTHDDPPALKPVEPDLADIQGVVVDEALRPVANATVQLMAQEATTTTNAKGGFTFSQLQPGLVTMRASAPGYLPVQASVDLVAGEVATPKLLLPIDASAVPYQELHHWQGFIELSASLATFATDLVLESVLNQSLCRCTFVFDVDEQPNAYVYEVYLEENLPDGPTGPSEYYWELIGSAADGEIESSFDPIPIYQVIDGSAFPEERTQITARVTGSAFWPSLQQEYTLFVTVFYRADPPAGWSAATEP